MVRSLGQEGPLEKGTAITSVFLPGEFHGQRSLVGYSPWGRKELDTTEQLTVSLHFSKAMEVGFQTSAGVSHWLRTTGSQRGCKLLST